MLSNRACVTARPPTLGAAAMLGVARNEEASAGTARGLDKLKSTACVRKVPVEELLILVTGAAFRDAVREITILYEGGGDGEGEGGGDRGIVWAGDCGGDGVGDRLITGSGV